jgi:hypothetical protein
LKRKTSRANVPQHPAAKNSIDTGMLIDFSDEQSENALISSRQCSDPDSNVTLSTESKYENDSAPMYTTEAGMMIDFSERQCQNERSQISVRLDPDSNSTLSRLVQFPKQHLQSLVTDAGM